MNPGSQAREAYDAATGADRDLLGRIALTPQAFWVGDWYPTDQVTGVVADYTGSASGAGAVGVLVLYAIPGRDCGLYSAGGVGADEYAGWVDAVATGIQGHPLVVLEPDALASLGDCDGQGDRARYLADAAARLTAAGARVYVDVGHSQWLPPEAAAERLRAMGVGAGVAGEAAARAFLGMGAHVTVLDRDLARLQALDEFLPCKLVTVVAHPFHVGQDVSDVPAAALLSAQAIADGVRSQLILLAVAGTAPEATKR